CFRSPEVDHHLDLRCPLDRQVCRLLTFENASRIIADDPKRLGDTCAVGHQSTGLGCLLPACNPGHAITESKGRKPGPRTRKKPIRADKQCPKPFLRNRSESLLEFAWITRL